MFSLILFSKKQELPLFLADIIDLNITILFLVISNIVWHIRETTSQF
jgi:hypothetical protein